MNLVCPYCSHDVADERKLLPKLPNPMDYIICYQCGSLSQLTTALKLEKANESDLPQELQREVEIFRHLVQSAHFVHCPPNNLH